MLPWISGQDRPLSSCSRLRNARKESAEAPWGAQLSASWMSWARNACDQPAQHNGQRRGSVGAANVEQVEPHPRGQEQTWASQSHWWGLSGLSDEGSLAGSVEPQDCKGQEIRFSCTMLRHSENLLGTMDVKNKEDHETTTGHKAASGKKFI